MLELKNMGVKKIMSKKRKIVIVSITLVAIFVVLNYGYFLENIKYLVSNNQTLVSNTAKNEEVVGTPNLLEINSLNIKAPIVYTNEKTEKAYQAALVNGVVHFPGTALVGDFGNVYIFGHSSDYLWSPGKYKSVFALLPKISIGEEVLITNQVGQIFKYKVIESKKVSANDLTVLGQQGYKRKLLTLQTSYPVGTALARWVVIAELEK